MNELTSYVYHVNNTIAMYIYALYIHSIYVYPIHTILTMLH